MPTPFLIPAASSRPTGRPALGAGTSIVLVGTVVWLCTVVWSATVAPAAEWPQWRGPDAQGHAVSARNLPVTWSETENVAWKTPLPGRGWSSPVIADGRIWMTTAIESVVTEEDRKRRLEKIPNSQTLQVSGPIALHALCVDRGSGKLLHDVELLTVENPQPIHQLNSYASPSPVLDGDRLYCHFGDYGTAAVDARTGQVVWRSRDQRLNHENGPGSTPVVWKDKLIVHCDGSDTQSIVAYDTATGAVAWKTDRTGELRSDPQLKKAYGTPLVLPIDGRDVLVSPAADWLYGYDPATGRELWKMSYGVLGFSIVPRPVAGHGLLYISTSFMQPELLAVRLRGADTPPEIAWREKKGAPSMPSPLLVGTELYMVSEKGVASCLDAKTGEILWTQRLGGNFSSSPLFADGRIYVGNRDGATFVFRPGRTYEADATNQLDGQIMATPAAIDREIYLRTDKALYRIENRAAAAAVDRQAPAVAGGGRP